MSENISSIDFIASHFFQCDKSNLELLIKKQIEGKFNMQIGPDYFNKLRFNFEDIPYFKGTMQKMTILRKKIQKKKEIQM